MWQRITLFTLALLARTAFLAWRGPAISTDTADYLRIADNISHHLAFSLSSSAPWIPTIFRAPLYPAFISLLSSMGAKSPYEPALVQSVLDSLVCLCVYSMVRGVARERWSVLAAVVYALHPGAIVTSTSLLSEGLFGSLCVFAVYFLAKGLERNSQSLCLAGGVTLGLAGLSRSIGAVLPFLFFAIILRKSRSKQLRQHALVMLTAALLILLPWVVRSSLLARSFVLVQGPSMALNFYYPTRMDWDQGDQQAVWLSFQRDDPCGKCFLAARNPTQMPMVSRFCFDEAIHNIRSAPLRYAVSRLRAYPQLMLTSFDSFTGYNESFRQCLVNRHHGRFLLNLLLMTVFAGAPFCLAALGVRKAGGNVTVGLCAVVCVFTLLIHIPMWIEYRYWQPVVPLLLVLSASGAESLPAFFASRKGGRMQRVSSPA
jgi:4-amino-4-deoxy-L-arabinose transferase-like glycosyltransferase